MTHPYEPPASVGGSSVLGTDPAGVPVIGLAHGSRHPRGADAIEALMIAVGAAAGVPAHAAYLDLAEPDLGAVVAALAADGHRRAVVVPLLFTVAFHATVDVPDAVAEAAASYGVELAVSDILGTGDDIAAVLRGALTGAGVDGGTDALLFAVGSSRPEANAAVADLAARLADSRRGDVRAAFGTCAPRVPDVLADLSAPVALWPLFLADGLLLDPLRNLADERGWTLVEPLGAQAAPLVLARYAAARDRQPAPYADHVPITPDHAGKAYAPTAPYEVTRVKIVELSEALGDKAVAGVLFPVAPPTFGAVVASPAWDALFTDPELGLQLARIVHADQQFRYLRPLEPGDVVTATLRIDKVRVRGPVEIISTSVEVHDEAEEHVLTATSTFVHTREAVA